MINGKITNFDDVTKKKEFKKKPPLLLRWTLDRKDDGFTKSIMVGDTFSVDEEVWVIVQILEVRIRRASPKVANFIFRTEVVAQNSSISNYQTKINKSDFGQPSEVKTVKNADGIFGYEPNKKVGDFVNLNRVAYRTVGRISNILCYKLSFGSFEYKFDIEEIQPLPFDEIRKTVKKERLKNVEITADSGNVTKINFKN